MSMIPIPGTLDGSYKLGPFNRDYGTEVTLSLKLPEGPSKTVHIYCPFISRTEVDSEIYAGEVKAGDQYAQSSLKGQSVACIRLGEHGRLLFDLDNCNAPASYPINVQKVQELILEIIRQQEERP